MWYWYERMWGLAFGTLVTLLGIMVGRLVYLHQPHDLILWHWILTVTGLMICASVTVFGLWVTTGSISDLFDR